MWAKNDSDNQNYGTSILIWIFMMWNQTLQGTYEYGKQLLQAALVLRRSLRYDMEPNHQRGTRLEQAWSRFSQGTSERANRLTVAAMFLNESDKVSQLSCDAE